MYDALCNLPLTSDLFAQAIHPTNPLVAVGLASGHVQTLRLPDPSNSTLNSGSDNDDANDDDDIKSTTSSLKSSASTTGYGRIETVWRTRRHKGSCRGLAFSQDGTQLFSTGTDGLCKVAITETGQVVDKICAPNTPEGASDAPCLLHVLTPQTFLLATDSGALHLYDLRSSVNGGGTQQRFGNAGKPAQTHYPHTDYVSSLTAVPPSETSTSGFSKQWITTGGTTLSVTDLRRGVLVRSADQEEELLSTCFASGLSTKSASSRGAKCIVGGGGGVLTLWEKGVWDDQDERIVLDRGADGAKSEGESVDVLAMLPSDALDGRGGKVVAAGMGNGVVCFVELGLNRVVDAVSHESPVDGVVGLGFDVAGRMITGGGSMVKVWHEKVDVDNGAYVDGEGSGSSDQSDDERNDDDDSENEEQTTQAKKRKTSQFPGGGSFSFAGLD